MGIEEEWTALAVPWRSCLELAWSAYAQNTIPVGAVLVDGKGDIVATGRNGVYSEDASTPSMSKSRLAHAEINALRDLDPEERYDDHVVYGSLEPCLLCVGAAVMANVGKIRYAGVDPYGGAAHVAATNPHIERLDFSVEGPLDGALGRFAAALHLEFFLRRNRDGHVVRTHREKAPEIFELGSQLHEAELFELSQSGALEEALVRLTTILG